MLARLGPACAGSERASGDGVKNLRRCSGRPNSSRPSMGTCAQAIPGSELKQGGRPAILDGWSCRGGVFAENGMGWATLTV